MCLCKSVSFLLKLLCGVFVFGYLKVISQAFFLKSHLPSDSDSSAISDISVSLFHQRYYLGQIFCKNFITFSSLTKHAPSEVHLFVFRQIQENFNQISIDDAIGYIFGGLQFCGGGRCLLDSTILASFLTHQV